MSDKIEITYTQVGDYLLPDLEVKDPMPPMGRWGHKRQQFLLENRTATYETMQEEGTLWPHLLEVDQSAEEMYRRLLEHNAKRNGETPELKRNDPMKWVQLMNLAKLEAEEVVMQDLILA